ncbi:MAG TPA: DUF1829 domain-containing protein [Phycisphaerae bacterium]|nr:DUF1829 domain-containing protein [Phycisphaerae bacterium]
MIEEIERLLDQYLAWLKDKTTLRQAPNDWVEITTPYLDRHNDYLQIYARKRDGAFILTDDGYVIEDLVQSGCKLDSPKRQDLLRMTLAGFGVANSSGVLEVRASPDNFALRKHNLVQAMLAVNDLFYLAVPMVASLFYEDMVAWLDANEIRYTPNVKFTGKSGYDHLFDFVIPKSRKQPERILQTITRPSRDTAETVAFKWIDTKDVRSPDSRAYAFLNDQEQKVPQGVVDALYNYEVTPVLWSGREAVKQDLAA